MKKENNYIGIDHYLGTEFPNLYKMITKQTVQPSLTLLYEITKCPYIKSHNIFWNDVIDWFQRQKIKNPKVEDLWLL